MKQYTVALTGLTPLLIHADDPEWSDKMSAWCDESANKKNSKPGDDRTPAWRWLGCLYHDGETLGIPSDNLMTMLMEAGSLIGRGKRATYKSVTQTSIIFADSVLPLLVKGKRVSFAELQKAVLSEKSFDGQKAIAEKHGFELFVKRATVGTNKHVRVRPRVNEWALEGNLEVNEDDINHKALVSIFETAGRYKGLGDWRPGSKKKPGQFGRFTAAIKEA